MREWKQMKSNDIHIFSYNVTTIHNFRIVSYTQITYGKIAQPMKQRSVSDGKLIMWKERKLSQMVGKYS